MAYVYILHSISLNKFYTGSCLDIQKRIIEHRNGTYSNSFTRKAKDWKLFLLISELEYKQSRLIESHIKKMKSSTYIQNLVKYPEIIEKLKIKYNTTGSFR